MPNLNRLQIIIVDPLLILYPSVLIDFSWKPTKLIEIQLS